MDFNKDIWFSKQEMGIENFKEVKRTIAINKRHQQISQKYQNKSNNESLKVKQNTLRLVV